MPIDHDARSRDPQKSLFPEQGAVSIEGTLERIRFASNEDAWIVAVVQLSDSPRQVTVVGNLAGVQVGEGLRLTGRWTSHPRFGDQFKVDSFVSIKPATLAGIERYLGSGLVKGIGRELASRLVKRFGIETLDIIDTNPKRLLEVEGIGPVRSTQILEAWEAQRSIRDIMVFLQSYGVSTALASRIYKQYGSGSRAVIQANPYRLASEVSGIGFKTADAIAEKLGISRSSPHRLEAGILFALSQRADEGDVLVSRPVLIDETARLLSVDRVECEKAVESLASRGDIAGEGDLAGLAYLNAAEMKAAHILARLASVPAEQTTLDIEREIKRYEADNGIELSALQKEAVTRAFKEKVLVITGGPGTGKTTLITCIIRILERWAGALGGGQSVALCAPTGRAAKRMAEATGREAKTIHRLLDFSPQKARFLRDAGNPIHCDALVADEVSMIDTLLFASLLDAIPTGARVILVGDKDQLPSVGPGNVLGDLISSGAIPVVQLTHIFRQASKSAIVVNAHRVNAGDMPELSAPEGSDFFFIERNEPQDILETVRELVTVRIPRRFGLAAREEIQVLTPMQRGLLGAVNMNRELQEAINPSGPALQVGSQSFRTGDRVMQIRNNYDLGVFNGDVGRIETLDEPARSLAVRFDDRLVPYEWDDLGELSLAYACSIHKSQGSEFPAVVIALHTQHFVLLRRNLLYTAITRGKRLAVLVGSRKAVAMAVKNGATNARCTLLAKRLAGAASALASSAAMPTGTTGGQIPG